MWLLDHHANKKPLHPTLIYIVKSGCIHYFLIFALKHRLCVPVRTASVRRFLCVYVLSKNKTIITFFFHLKLPFYSREKSQYIAWVCSRNVYIDIENIRFFFGVRSIFISPNEQQKLYFHEWWSHEWKCRFWCSWVNKKSILHRKNQIFCFFYAKIWKN